MFSLSSEGAPPAESAGAFLWEGLAIGHTPLGHLGDITLRMLEALRTADLVLCEDTRTTAKLLGRYGLRPKLLSFHAHNEHQRQAAVLESLRGGLRVLLVSDAGTPLISDPGFRLVRAVVREGLPLTSLPGPSSPINALVLSAASADRFGFFGFLPSKGAARQSALQEALAQRLGSYIFLESPRRLTDLLKRLEGLLGQEDRLAVAREMTKRHETVYRGTAAEVSALLGAGEVRGECVVVVSRKPPAAAGKDMAEPLESLDPAILVERLAREGFSAKESARIGRALWGLDRKAVYTLYNRLKS